MSDKDAQPIMATTTDQDGDEFQNAAVAMGGILRFRPSRGFSPLARIRPFGGVDGRRRDRSPVAKIDGGECNGSRRWKSNGSPATHGGVSMQHRDNWPPRAALLATRRRRA